MSLREDIIAMELHSANGTLREWFEGTAPILFYPCVPLKPDVRRLPRPVPLKLMPAGAFSERDKS